MNWVFLLFVLIQLKDVRLMSMTQSKSKSFGFPDGTEGSTNGGGEGGVDDGAIFMRDGHDSHNAPAATTAAAAPAPAAPAPAASAPSSQSVGTTGAGPSMTTCICVPTGQCTATKPVSTDGSGQIDVRIVSNIPASTASPAVACQPNLVLCCQGGPYKCGVRYPPISGSKAPTSGQSAFGAYPWQAVLLGPGDDYAGAGALITNLHVLTVAHKVTDYLSGKALKVRLGEWDGASESEPIKAQEYMAAKIFVHSNYNANNLKNDVAIIRLSGGVPLGQTPTINTACLPATSFSGTRCYVAGWGKNDFSNNGAYQAIQKEVDVPVRSQGECQSSLSATRLGSTFVFDNNTFMCAGGESGKDACTGDGGSPLMCELGGKWFVAGLVSWGIGCATGGVPGVYVNVANYVSWIQSTIQS